MGNEESNYPKLQIEEEAVEVTDNWSLHYARSVGEGNICTRSAFVSQPVVNRNGATPLEKFAKVCKLMCMSL